MGDNRLMNTELKDLIERDAPSPVWDGLERRLLERMRPSMHVWLGEILDEEALDFSICADFAVTP